MLTSWAGQGVGMSLREASLMGMKVRRICLLHLGAPCINGGNGDSMFLRRLWWRRRVKERESSRCRVRGGRTLAVLPECREHQL